MNCSSVLLVDDHALFRSGLRMVIESEFENVVVEESDSVSDALANRKPPSIVLLDVELPGVNGVDALALFARQWPRVPIIILSAHAEPAVIERAIAHGARDYLRKAETVPRMIEAIRAALCGGDVRRPPPAPSGDRPRLTPRQIEVLELLCQGLPNRQIGKRLGVSEHTIRGHVQSLLFALDVGSRSEAIVVARRQGWIS